MLNNVFFCFYACDDNYDLSKDETLCDYVMFNSGQYSTLWNHCAETSTIAPNEIRICYVIKVKFLIQKGRL